MKRRIRHVISLALAVCSIICLVQAFGYASIPKGQKEISILELETPCDVKTAGMYQADLPFAFWGEQQNMEIQNKDLGRSTKAALITVYGNSSLVLESSRFLDSSMSGYCLIDRQTSLELFQSASAEGQRIEIDKTAYQVAGVLASAEHTVLIQADAQKETVMDKVSLRIPEKENRQERIRLFCSQTGIAGKEIPVHFYGSWGNFMAYLLPVFLLGTVLYGLLKLVYVHRDMPVQCLLLLLLFLGMLAVSIWILDISGGFPVEMLPSKWSDFEFWSRLWEGKVQEMEFLLQIEKSRPQLILCNRFFRSAGYSILAVFAACLALPSISKWKSTEILMPVFSSLLVTFLVVVKISTGNGAAADNRMIWMLYPAYFTGKYTVQKLEGRQKDR